VDTIGIEAIAKGVVQAMENDHGPDQELTAAVTIATTRKRNGEAYIRCMAIDADGIPLPPWHLKGILRDLADNLPDH
jgi:hypothetical protein